MKRLKSMIQLQTLRHFPFLNSARQIPSLSHLPFLSHYRLDFQARTTTRVRSYSLESASMANNNDGVSGNNSNLKRGALIVLEGLDRSGKSSQSAMLSSYLDSQNFQVEMWRFPDRTTPIGKMISSYLSSDQELDDKAVHLLFSANRWEKRHLMEEKLKAGISLIVDRYSYSGIAFSAAKGLDLDWCKAPEAGLPAPDLVFYLDISPEKAAERGRYGEERYEKINFQRKVAEAYKILSDSSWQKVDALLAINHIHEKLKELSLKCIISCQRGKELCYLWR